MSVRRRTSRTARTHTIFAYGQATCADAIASAVGAVKGGDSWVRALGLELTGRPEAIIQGKGSAGVKERGHTQQALTSSGTCNIVVPCASLNLLVKPYLLLSVYRPIELGRSRSTRSKIDSVLMV